VSAIRQRAPVTLVGPAYAVGQLVPVAEAVPGEVSGELADRLRDNGFVRCSVSDQPPSALAARAVAALLRQVGEASRRITAVIYATCSYGTEPEPGTGPEQVARERVLRPVGLDHLPVYGVWLAESGNLATVLRLARALVRGAGRHTVLCVVADKVPAGPGQYRAMPNGVTINGDGAAACLLSTELPGDYLVEGVAQVSAPVMVTFAKGQGLRKHLQIMAGIRGCCTGLYAASGQAPSAYRWLVTNNYARRTLHEFADMAQLPHDRLFLDNVARHGHVFTADGLINLADLTRTADVPAGDRVLVLSSGPLTWGAVGLVRTTPAPPP
jgi:3-oxoacyl-[acyl-carrier-protein] synthase-3